MTVVIVQCRLSSTRLPRKALKDLGGRPVLEWTLRAMHKVPADAYYVATDTESFSELEPVVKGCGWECFAGPKDDVLERFCLLIEKLNADIVVRATADNPFLFYEAAASLLELYTADGRCDRTDYITWQGLPHGSGIEIFNARSLLRAKAATDSPYDHEHVGPALYNHPESFTAEMLTAPARWHYPGYRTTIDTYADYLRALMIVSTLSQEKAPEAPYTTEQIVSAFSNPAVGRPVCCVPSVKKGQGTGHLRRCLTIALEIGAIVYIPDDADLSETDQVVSEYVQRGLHPWQITSVMPGAGEYSLIVTDAFALDEPLARTLHDAAPVVAVDEGSPNTAYCDYLLNIIPPAQKKSMVNMEAPQFMEMPRHRKTGGRIRHGADFKRILIVAGGEDPADLVIPVALAFGSLHRTVTAIRSSAEHEQDRIPAELKPYIQLVQPVPGLREKLADYDLVVTHYGLTAYEAVAAGCAVLLLATTSLHAELADTYGFKCLAPSDISAREISAVLKSPEKLYRMPPAVPVDSVGTAGGFIRSLSYGRRFTCPVCGPAAGGEKPAADDVEARTPRRTFRRCASCGCLYMAWTLDENDMSYSKQYFFDQYKQQYGKTYLEDFNTIKVQCVRRISQMDFIYHRKLRSTTTPTILDIGCAFGPFLSAAVDAGWQAFGVDVSQEAVDYIRSTLLFPAACASVPDFDPVKEFGVRSFDAVTMWYVIEHFRNLDAVLRQVADMVKPGGIFAFSTPSASGVSGKFNRRQFFEQSPADHYTIWEPAHAQAILARYGFKVVRIVITGHHPERFPFIGAHGWQKHSLPYTAASAASHALGLGDTFEVYCRRIAE